MKGLWEETRIAIVGASGIVGTTLLELLQTKKIKTSQLFLFGSQPKTFSVQGISYHSKPLGEIFPEVDLVFLCAGSAVSEKLWGAFPPTTLLIDLSSRYRMDPSIPLIVPEINAEKLSSTTRKVASPNCVATLLSLPLSPLHKTYGLQKVIATTYQAASGGGIALMQRLYAESAAILAGETPDAPYAFNLYSHESPLQEDGYVSEEIKIMEETQKILDIPHLPITATSIRVPVPRAHSISVYIELEKTPCISEVTLLLQKQAGIEFWEDRKNNQFATPHIATKKSSVFCGRVRSCRFCKNSLEMWIVGDQLLKGAALNALQIAEICLQLRKSHVLEKEIATKSSSLSR